MICFDYPWSPSGLFTLFFALQFSIDVSFDEFEAALVQFFQEGQDCAQNILVSIVVILGWQLASVLEACGATRLSMMGRTMSLIEWRQATSFRNQLTIIIGGAHLILGIAIAIWALETYGCAHLVWTVVVGHIARRRLWRLVLRYLELLGLLLMTIQRAWILCLTITWMHSSIIQGSWSLLKSKWV